MKILIVLLLQIFVLLFIITQIILPIFSRYQFFWWFKPKTKTFRAPKKDSKIKDLSELEKDVIARTEAYKDVLENVKGTEEQLSEIKRKKSA